MTIDARMTMLVKEKLIRVPTKLSRPMELATATSVSTARAGRLLGGPATIHARVQPAMASSQTKPMKREMRRALVSGPREGRDDDGLMPSTYRPGGPLKRASGAPFPAALPTVDAPFPAGVRERLAGAVGRGPDEGVVLAEHGLEDGGDRLHGRCSFCLMPDSSVRLLQTISCP